METLEKKLKNLYIAQWTILWIILGFLTLCTTFGILSIWKGAGFSDASGWFGMGSVVLGVVEACLALERSKTADEVQRRKLNNTSAWKTASSSESNDSSKEDQKTTEESPRNDGPAQTNDFWARQRALTDEVIKSFDEYVASSFPQLPFDRYTGKLKNKSIESLREQAFEMQKHLHLEKFLIVVELSDTLFEKEAGLFIREGEFFARIKINSSLLRLQMDATLAHEMSHAFQAFNGKPHLVEDNTLLSEQFTDILTYYLGFDELVQGGYYLQGINSTSKLGYVESGDFMLARKVYARRTSSLNEFRESKRELEANINAYEGYIQYICITAEKMAGKYMPPDDKSFVLECLRKYSSSEILSYISELRSRVGREAYLEIQKDIIGIELRIESVLENYKKIKDMSDFVIHK